MSKRRDYILQKNITLACAVLVVCTLVSYVYFLNVSVVHVVMRKEAAQKVAALNTDIALLEAEYIKAQHAVTERMAHLTGFAIESEKVFITRSETSLVLNSN